MARRCATVCAMKDTPDVIEFEPVRKSRAAGWRRLTMSLFMFGVMFAWIAYLRSYGDDIGANDGLIIGIGFSAFFFGLSFLIAFIRWITTGKAL